MSNFFDRILKENIEAVFPNLSKKLLGIEIAHSEALKDKLQRTTEREADFLRKIVTPDGDEFIIHLEFQATNDQEMLHRMQLYHALITQKYRLPVRQFVIYIGRSLPQMRTQLKPEEVFKGFELINMQLIDYQQLLQSKVPEEVVLAILGDFDSEDQETALQRILQRLDKLSNSPNTLNKYIYHLLTFARLRNLTHITQKQLESMGIIYDIEKDAFFKKGEIRGMEKGLEEGMEKGLEKGEIRKARKVVVNLIKANKLSLEEIAEVSELSLEEVKKIAQEMK